MAIVLPHPCVLNVTTSKNTNLARVQDRIIITKFSDTVSFDRRETGGGGTLITSRYQLLTCLTKLNYTRNIKPELCDHSKKVQ